MSLTKSDLASIDRIVKSRVTESEVRINKKIKSVNKKVDSFFNFLDKDYSKIFRRVTKVEKELGIPAPEF